MHPEASVRSAILPEFPAEAQGRHVLYFRSHSLAGAGLARSSCPLESAQAPPVPLCPALGLRAGPWPLPVLSFSICTVGPRRRQGCIGPHPEPRSGAQAPPLALPPRANLPTAPIYKTRGLRGGWADSPGLKLSPSLRRCSFSGSWWPPREQWPAGAPLNLGLWGQTWGGGSLRTGAWQTGPQHVLGEKVY